MPILRRLLELFPGVAPVDFKPLSKTARAKVDAFLAAKPSPVAPKEIVAALDAGRGRFAREYERVLDEVKRRCGGAEIWQNFYLDLLDEDGQPNEDDEGVGADPVEPEEELRRLLAGAEVFPEVRARYAWELGYQTLRYALARPNDPQMHLFAAKAAAEDFHAAFSVAEDAEGRVNAIGDLAGALLLAGETEMALLLCDYAAAAISAEEAVRQELHRVRRDGAAFVRESYGAS